MGIHIRTATEHDYAMLGTLWNERFLALTSTSETLRLEDRHRRSDLGFTRMIVEQDGTPRAFGGATQRAGDPSLREFTIEIAANADARADRLDDRLYESLLEGLAPRSPHRLFAWAREDDAVALHFWQAHGFEIAQRSYESALELARLDRRDLEAREPHAKARLPGLALESLGAWLARADADTVQRELYDLQVAVDAVVPTPGAFTLPPRFANSSYGISRTRGSCRSCSPPRWSQTVRPSALSRSASYGGTTTKGGSKRA